MSNIKNHSESIPYFSYPKRDVSHDFIVWIDVETTGLNELSDELLEVGAVVTDTSGKPMSESPFHALIRHDDLSDVMNKTTPSVLEIHSMSGLWTDLWYSPLTETHDEVASRMRGWILECVGESYGTLYFGGNSPYLDRSFVRRWLPSVAQIISHRTLDMTSVSLFASFTSEIEPYRRNRHSHRAVNDVLESVEEFSHYASRVEHLNKMLFAD